MRYVSLLRGINISGKNKLAMKELKIEFERLGFTEVITYINSGNILFTSETDDLEFLSDKIKSMLKNSFQLDIPVYLTTKDKLSDVLIHAPKWWGLDDKEIYDNVIFIMPPTTYEDVYSEIGKAKAEYEKINNYENVVYWSFELKSYSKTNWIKTASSSINDKVTIRTANTIRKLLELDEKIKL